MEIKIEKVHLGKYTWENTNRQIQNRTYKSGNTNRKYRSEIQIGKYTSGNTNREIQIAKSQIETTRIGKYKSKTYESGNTNEKNKNKGNTNQKYKLEHTSLDNTNLNTNWVIRIGKYRSGK